MRLTRYIVGDMSPAERELVELWIVADPKRVELLRRIRDVWSAMPQGPKRDAVDVAAARDAVFARLGTVEHDRPVEAVPPTRRQVARVRPAKRFRYPSPPARPVSRYFLGALAAAAAVTIAVVGLRTRPFGGGAAAAPTTYATGQAQRATITLPDSSVVMLNVASRLEVPSDFLAGNRVLHLDGQASFRVRHQYHAPFTVVAGAITTHVLGTNFVVRHYASDPTSIVAVRTGRVSVQDSVTGPIVLVTAQQAAFNRNGEALVGPADAGHFAFETGVLSIKRTPLRDAIPELDRWYDADIRLGDKSLGHELLTSRLASSSLTDLATMLELTFDVRVVRNNRIFTLYHR